MEMILIIFTLLIAAIFFVYVFKFSTSNYPRRPSSSLLDPSSNLRIDIALVATLDGTISLVDFASRKILWSAETGVPIYSSYQTNSESDSKCGDGKYLDCGDDWKDWNLYQHDKRKGTVQRLDKTSKDLFSIVRETNTGLCEISQQRMATTILLLDAKTGTIIKTVNYSDSGTGCNSDGQNPLLISEELIYITRTDYVLHLFGEVLWNLKISEFEAKSMKSSGLRSMFLYRIRDHQLSNLKSSVGQVVDETARSLFGKVPWNVKLPLIQSLQEMSSRVVQKFRNCKN